MQRFYYRDVPRFPLYCRAKRFTLYFTNARRQRNVVGFIDRGESLKVAFYMNLLNKAVNGDAASVMDDAKVGCECGDDCGCAPVYGCEPLHAHRWATGPPASARPAPG
jgi:hypothetical protein